MEEKQIASKQGGESKLGHEKRRDRPSIAEAEVEAAESGRERLKRHRREVAGRVWIPDMWGQEDFLKDWIDSTVFDAAVRSGGITSARAALMDEGRRAAARIQNSLRHLYQDENMKPQDLGEGVLLGVHEKWSDSDLKRSKFAMHD
ncbi:hypothetical protein SASPL_136054 [Salvia splendens]|uniref:Protein BIC1 n=1 Tax=Salvia splendens TaxID=180675 RepID=A0A8X8WZ69_SALSN|nr:hypothetical protein SASPL_136054 [Salvia splendens]